MFWPQVFGIREREARNVSQTGFAVIKNRLFLSPPCETRIRSYSPLQHSVQLQRVSRLKVYGWIETLCGYYDSLIKIIVGLKPDLHEQVIRASSKMASNLR